MQPEFLRDGYLTGIKLQQQFGSANDRVYLPLGSEYYTGMHHSDYII